MSVSGHVEQSDAGAGVKPGVPVGERCQRIDWVTLLSEMTTVLQIRGRHLCTLQGGVVHRCALGRSDIGGLDGLGEQSFITISLLVQIGGHTRRSDGVGLSLSSPVLCGEDDSATYKPNRT